MALKKTVVTPQGFTAIDAYHRIEAVRLSSKTYMQFNVYSHIDANTPAFFDEYLFDCDYDLTGDNPLAQAYQFLKTQSEFETAVDC